MLKFRRAAVMLALAAMALRGLMPVGWMPNPRGMSETAFIICDMGERDMSAMDKSEMSGMDMSNMDMSKSANSSTEDQAPARHSDDGHQHEVCPFAASPHLAAPSVLALMLLPALAGGFMHDLSRVRPRFELTQYAAQSPRAPPRLA
jgi:hypothetical protein